MIYALIFIIIGILIGMFVPLPMMAIASFYISVGILAGIDAIVGALKASYNNEFDLSNFLVGLLINMSMAMALSWMGDKLGVPLYYVAVFVFGTRLFNNMAEIRVKFIDNLRASRQESKNDLEE